MKVEIRTIRPEVFEELQCPDCGSAIFVYPERKYLDVVDKDGYGITYSFEGNTAIFNCRCGVELEITEIGIRGI